MQMTHIEFSVFLCEVLENIKTVLNTKEKEYSSDKNRFHNFVEAGADEEYHPLVVLDILKSKHRISEKDITRAYLEDGTLPSKEMLKEKLGDQINYLILKWAMFESLRK